ARTRPDERRTGRRVAPISRHPERRLRPRQRRSGPDRRPASRLKGKAMSIIGTAAPRRRRIARLGAAAAVILLSTAALPDLGAGHEAMVKVAASRVTVTIDHHAFAPSALTIAVGTTVIWKNADDTPHTVTDKSGGFRSSGLDTGDSFSHTFAT